MPKVKGSFSGAINAADLALFKNLDKVVWNGVLYACVRRSANFAFKENVPQRDFAPQQKVFSFVDCGREVCGLVVRAALSRVVVFKPFPKDCGKSAPESVLRMHVKESRAAACRRWHCSKNKNAALRIPHRRDCVLDSCFLLHAGAVSFAIKS